MLFHYESLAALKVHQVTGAAAAAVSETEAVVIRRLGSETWRGFHPASGRQDVVLGLGLWAIGAARTRGPVPRRYARPVRKPVLRS
jgi:hypothetical protein